MSDTKLDPYYQWLGIPAEEQPPHLYRLLGIKPLEENPDVIEAAADRQMAHVRTYQSGKNAELSQKLLNELSAAKVRLLDPAKKAAYDAELKSQLDGDQSARHARPTSRPLAVAQPLREAATEPKPVAPKPHAATPSVRRKRNSNAVLAIAVIGSVVALLLLSVVGFIGLKMLGSNPQVAAGDTPPSTAKGEGETPDQEIKPTNESPTPPVPPVVPISNNNDGSDNEPADDDQSPVAPAHDEPVDDEPADNTLVDNEPADPVDKPSNPPADDGEQVAGVDEPAKPEKLPVPDRATRDAKRKEILQIFPVDEARTFEEKGQLAEQLIQTARDTKSDMAAKFALLNLAREQASEAGQIKLAFESIDELSATFEFDPDAVRIASIDAAIRAKLPPAARKEIITTGLTMLDDFLAANRYAEADALLDRCQGIARSLRDAQLIRQLADQRRAVDDLAAGYKKVQAAFAALKTNPNDADANLAAGRYLTFVKGDWEGGLSHLAKGSDKLLSSAAQADLANPQTSPTQLTAADAWWNAAEAEKDADAQKLSRARSGFWYRKAVDELAGLDKAKAEQRIDEAGEFVATPTHPTITSPRDVKKTIARASLCYFTFDKDAWVQQDGRTFVLSQNLAARPQHFQLHSGSQVTGISGEAAEFDGKGTHIVVPGLRERILGTPTISIVGWCKPDRSKEGYIFSVGHSATSCIELVAKDGHLAFNCVASEGGAITHSALPVEERWVHFACVTDGRKMRTYLDGEVASERAIQINQFHDKNVTSETAQIGAQAKVDHRWGRFYRGLLDEFAVIKGVLTADDVKRIYAAGRAGKGAIDVDVTVSSREPLELTDDPKSGTNGPADDVVARPRPAKNKRYVPGMIVFEYAAIPDDIFAEDLGRPGLIYLGKINDRGQWGVKADFAIAKGYLRVDEAGEYGFTTYGHHSGGSALIISDTRIEQGKTDNGSKVTWIKLEKGMVPFTSIGRKGNNTVDIKVRFPGATRSIPLPAHVVYFDEDLYKEAQAAMQRPQR